MNEATMKHLIRFALLLLLVPVSGLAMDQMSALMNPFLDMANQGMRLANSITSGVASSLMGPLTTSIRPNQQQMMVNKTTQTTQTETHLSESTPIVGLIDVVSQDHNPFLSTGLGLIDSVSMAIGTKGSDERDSESSVAHPTIEVVGKTAVEIIQQLGYKAEKHRILVDGYYIQMERIVNPLITGEERAKQVPVLLNHGIFEDSRSYISTGRYSRPARPPSDDPMDKGNKCLAMYLSNNNYDVWLLNSRGVTKESSRHVPEIKEEKYWHFTLDDLAMKDLPKQVDYVREVTKQDKVAYVGYSQSTYLMFAILANRPDFATKLVAFIALAPIVYTAHFESLTRFMSHALIAPLQLLQPDAPVLNVGFSNILDFLLPGACGQILLRDTLCKFFISLISGSDDTMTVIDESYFSHFPRPTSFMVVTQFAQAFNSGCFCNFDYGPNANLIRYGQLSPPAHNLAAISLKNITLFRGLKDHLSTAPDIEHLIGNLSVSLYEDHVIPEYNHIDFIYADNTYEKVNRHILRILNELTLGAPPLYKH